MPLKLLNISLLIAVIVGGIFTYQASRQNRRLEAEFQRLAVKVGDLAVGDPALVYVQALPTDDPLHFRWRVYVPANFNAKWAHGGGYSMSTNSDPCEFICMIRLAEDDAGRLNVHHKEGNGSGRTSLGGTKLADLVRGREDEILVEQLGKDGVAVVRPDEVAVFLRLRLSDDLKREAEKKLDSHSFKRYGKELFKMRLGDKAAFGDEP